MYVFMSVSPMRVENDGKSVLVCLVDKMKSHCYVVGKENRMDR